MTVVKYISVSIAVLLLIGTYLASTFWVVFLIPLPALISCQWVALKAEIKTAEKFFGFTDLAYYLIIGVVVGLGARYLPMLDPILQQDAELTFEQAVAALPEAREEARRASEESLEAARSLANTPDDVLFDCSSRQHELRIQKSVEITDQIPDRSVLMHPQDYPLGCEIPLSIRDNSARATGDAISANNRHHDLRMRVEAGPDAPVRASDFISEEWLRFLLFTVFPALILCGVMLKVGKTSLSIRKLAN